MILGLIPARLKSTRLPNKPLLLLDGIPIIIHVLKRAHFCKKLDRIIVCTDSNKIISIVKSYGFEAIKTKLTHKNGTDRIAEVAKKFINNNLELIIDIQCDEIFLKPDSIDKLIKFHKKNNNFDIVVPHTEIKNYKNRNIVKILPNNNKKIIYMSRFDIPFNFYKIKRKILRHMDIISFNPEKLISFSKLKNSKLEKFENIELLRGIENNFEIGTFLIENEKNTFSINTKNEYKKSKKLMRICKIRKLY
jgi:3-deoxy-manno-octulosonate cytidylyltransferase (CMP-KDO synthetase)